MFPMTFVRPQLIEAHRLFLYFARHLHTKGATNPPMEEILTPEQLAQRLQVKPSWVYEQTRDRTSVRNPDTLPYIKMGRYLRFDWNDVLGWLERHKKAA